MKSQDNLLLSRKHLLVGRKRVFVGLSGGVDSAVSAALLKEQGFDVTGVFIKAWTPEGYPCTWKEDRRSAMKVAAVLDIPFLTLDLEKEYKKEVVDYMIEYYKRGETPNPDVMCNKEIKFGHFLKFALEKGADFVATGHYALCKEARIMNYELWEGSDKNKDQSYFLWTLTQDQLKHILFPIGHLQKSEVRKLAEKFGLPQATRKDSQGLCFLGKIDMKGFLKEYINTEKGNVLNKSGKKIGEHDGAVLYTIGERHGFRLFKQLNEPMYVVSKDIKNNTITVSSKIHTIENKSYIKTENIVIKNQNWISGKMPDKDIKCRLRYRQEKINCRINNNQLFIDNNEFITPGQSVVFYDGEICLGGGIIDL